MSEQVSVLYIGGIAGARFWHIRWARSPASYTSGTLTVCDYTVSGDPGRFRTGKIELRPDEEWKVKMRGADKNVVTALTAPLLLNYRYFGRRETSKWYRH